MWQEGCDCGPDTCETCSSTEIIQQPDASSGTPSDDYFTINIVVGKFNVKSLL